MLRRAAAFLVALAPLGAPASAADAPANGLFSLPDYDL